jgi:SAM-dependent methyltransferase
MTRHPEGENQTLELIRVSGVTPPCRILDMGAGDGDTVRLLKNLGLDAVGIDLEPGNDVMRGDILNAPFPADGFDAVISQCTLFVTGDRDRAYSESARVLRKGGRLLVSDVFFDTKDSLFALAGRNGLDVLWFRDATEAWKEYYIESIWNGTAYEFCACMPKGKCRYYLMICEKR